MKDHIASVFTFLLVLFCKAARGFVFLDHHEIIRYKRKYSNSFYSTTNGSHCNYRICHQRRILHRHDWSSLPSNIASSRTKEVLTLKAHNDGEEDSSQHTILSSSQNHTKWMYCLLACLHGSIVSLLVSMPNRVLQSSRNIHPFRYNASFVGGVYGHVIASVTSIILSFHSNHHNDVEHDMSAEETKIRPRHSDEQLLLNWGLLSFSIVGLFAIPGETAFHANYKSAFILFMYIWIVKLMGFTFSFQNLMKATSNGDNSLIQNMIHTMKCTLNKVVGIVRCKPKNKDAKIYQILHQIIFYLSLGNNLLCIMQPQNSYLHKDISKIQFDKSLHVSASARLIMISSVLIVMQNAANEKRLCGRSLFVLNITLGLWAFSVGIAEGIIDQSFVFRKSLNMVMLSWPFFFKAFTMTKMKNEIQ